MDCLNSQKDKVAPGADIQGLGRLFEYPRLGIGSKWDTNLRSRNEYPNNHE